MNLLLFFFILFQKSSEKLSDVIGQQLNDYIKDEGVVRLLQSFLHPHKCIIERKESPQAVRVDYLVSISFYFHVTYL